MFKKTAKQRANDLEIVEKIASKSKLTQRDADEIAKKINKAAAKRFLKFNIQ